MSGTLVDLIIEDSDAFDNLHVTHSIFSGVKTRIVGRNAAEILQKR